MNIEITKKTPLLKKNGHLRKKGYAKKMNFIYNRENAGYPWVLKEWIFYQFIKDHYAVQLTIGHLTYMCSVTATLIDLNTGHKWEINSMKPFFVPKLDKDPEGESYNEFKDKNLYMSFRVTKTQRILCVKGWKKDLGTVDIRIEADNDVNNEKMVIATPFKNPKQFYLNYKENYYAAKGWAQFGERTIDMEGSTGLVDWGRGIWPYSHQWFWGNLTSHIDGVPFGFNIGWGFGDLSYATENMFFYNKKAYKLGRMLVARDENDYMKPWKLRDEDGKMELNFTPMFDNYTQNKYVVIDTHCNQVYGWFDGWIETEDGRKEFKHVLAFIEHAVNKW